MRIAFDHQIFAAQTYGGISRYIARLAQQYVAGGEEVRIIAPLHVNRYISGFQSGVVYGTSLRKLLPHTYRFVSALNHVASIPVLRSWKPDVLHETYYTSRDLSSGKCPVVITVHDMIHELYAGQFSRRDTTSRDKRCAVERADHVICISENTRRDLIRLHGVPENKTSVIYHGFEMFEVKKAEGAERPHPRPYLLYVGLRGGYKNFEGLLRAVAASPMLRADYDVIAFGGGSFRSSETAMISQLGFGDDRVLQMGGDDSLLGELYAHADAFVYPSAYEGFGFPPLEAMTQGCPVVASNTSSMPEVIGDAGEFFDPGSVEDIRRAIEAVVYSRDRGQELVQLGYARIKMFSWEKCASETMAVYRSLQ